MTEINESELIVLRRRAAERESIRHWTWFGCKVTCGLILFFVAVTFAYKAIAPSLNLHRANTENQAVIKEQKAHSEAAEYAAQSAITQAHAKAEAMIIEAHGLAESQKIIAATLTPEYIRYLYVEAIRDNPNQVIYVPTEAGMPVLEAGRAVETPPTTVVMP